MSVYPDRVTVKEGVLQYLPSHVGANPTTGKKVDDTQPFNRERRIRERPFLACGKSWRAMLSLFLEVSMTDEGKKRILVIARDRTYTSTVDTIARKLRVSRKQVLYALRSGHSLKMNHFDEI